MSTEIKKPELNDASAVSLPHFVSVACAERYPCLAAYWFSSVWPDGTPKQAARVSLSVYLGRLQVQLQLIGTGLMLRLDLEDPLLVWDALEAVLSGVSIPWQRDPWVKPEEPGKGKKK